MGHDVVASHLHARGDFLARLDRPMEKTIEAGHPFPVIQRFYMLKESGEAPDDFTTVEILGHLVESFEGDARFPGTRHPEIAG